MKKEIILLSSKEIYRNKWMILREDDIQRSDGGKGIYSVIEKPDFTVIIPLDGDSIFAVEQYRYPLERRTLELPQGSWENVSSASFIEIAAGELREETGLEAGKFTYVGYQKIAQGYSTQGYHIYLAEKLRYCGQKLEPEEVGLIVKKIKISDFLKLILKGDITDATSVTSFFLAKEKKLI